MRPERVLGLSAALILHGLLLFWLSLTHPDDAGPTNNAAGLETVFIDMSTPVIAPPPPLPEPDEPDPPAEPPRPAEPIRRQAVAEPAPDVPAVPTEPPALVPALSRETAAAPPSAPAEPSQPTESTGRAAAIDLTGIHAGPLSDWQATLLRHLHAHLRYPAQARRRHQQGVAQVRFVMDRSGRLHSARLESGSGHELLDEEALAVLARAQPLPKPPANLAGATIEIVIPVVYQMRAR